MKPIRLLTFALAGCATMALTAQTQPPAAPPQQPRQPSEIELVINGAPGLPPKIAVPDLIPLSSEPETVAAAKTVGEVLWDDLNFEREFYLIPRDTYRSIPAAASTEQVALDRWKEIGADGVVVGSIRKGPNGYVVEVRLLQVVGGRVAMGKQYSGSLNSVKDGGRIYAHTAADDIHQSQRQVRGVARTKLLFSSDRDGTRMKGPVGDRDISNIYRSDYDGANQTRITYTAVDRYHAGLGAQRGRDRLCLLAERLLRHHRPVDGVRDARAETGQRIVRGAELPAGVVARRHEDRFHVEPGRQPGDLLHEPRRKRDAARDQQSCDRRDADVVADGPADRVRLGSHGSSADLRREHRRDGTQQDHQRDGLRSARPGRRRRSTRSRTRHNPAEATTSACTSSPQVRRVR